MPSMVFKGLRGRGSSVDLETNLDRLSLNALLEIWYLGAYDNLDPGPGGTVIDLGANVGDFTLRASKWVGESGTVIAVEPMHRHVALLKNNLARNRISNVIVVEKAIGDREGEVEVNGASVETTSVDEITDELGVKAVDSIKIDIEGAEMKAISGATRNLARVQHVAVETHSDPLFRSVYESLKSNGYSVRRPSPSAMMVKMACSIAVNLSPFLTTEWIRTRFWDSAGPPFVWNASRWIVSGGRPDWLKEESGLSLLSADRAPPKPTP